MSGDPANVLLLADINRQAIENLMQRYRVAIEWLPDGADIPGSFWGAPEAGIIGTRAFVRSDTPVHSLLHEASHIICMRPSLRETHAGNAESDDLEEAAVCYLQVLLADVLPEVGRARLMNDMDRWGYSFRLGSTARWFAEDAEDARDWLLATGIINAEHELSWRLRSDAVL